MTLAGYNDLVAPARKSRWGLKLTSEQTADARATGGKRPWGNQPPWSGTTKQAAAKMPTNTRMGDAPSTSLDLKDVPNAWGVKSSVDAIDNIHGLSKYSRKVGVVYDEGLRTTGSLGQLRGTPEDSYPEIGIYPGMPPVVEAGTFAHEFGHLLDSTLWPKSGYASENEFVPLAVWHAAVKQSEAYETLSALLESATASDRDRKLAEYLLRGRELFARTYAQFVAERTNDPNLTEWLMAYTKGADEETMPKQWSPKDFAPIAAALEKMLREVQYMK